MIKISFKPKTASQILLELKLHKKYAILQRSQQHEVNKTDDFIKSTCEKKRFSANTCTTLPLSGK